MDEQTVSSVRSRFKARETENPCIGDTLVVRVFSRRVTHDTVAIRLVDKHKNYSIRGGQHYCRPIMALFRTRDWPSRFQIGQSFWLEWEYACHTCGELRRRVERDFGRPNVFDPHCTEHRRKTSEEMDFPASEAGDVNAARAARVWIGPGHWIVNEAESEGELGVEWNTCE